MSTSPRTQNRSRRDFLKAGMYAVGVSAILPGFLQRISLAQTAQAVATDPASDLSSRILVVVEMSGGNDGLNTVVPYADAAYHRARPRLGIHENAAIHLDDHHGLHPACTGLEAEFKQGRLAIVHGCGYPEPNLSHFTSMEYWHTATPGEADTRGWLGRYADAAEAEPKENYIVNIASQQSRAVVSDHHAPVVFKDPKAFRRIGTDAQQRVFDTFGEIYPTRPESHRDNPALAHVNAVSRAATSGAARVRNACEEYRTLIDYGGGDLQGDLKKVAAMIAADLPTRIYYVSLGGFDTHAAQAGAHQLLMVYLSDALRGFMRDVDRIGRGDDIAVMCFTEFGRRVGENASGGTDHGTAGPMFILGNQVRGGFHGTPVSLTDLDDGNLKMTTDFRRVYASMIGTWLGCETTDDVLHGEFEPLGLVA